VIVAVAWLSSAIAEVRISVYCAAVRLRVERTASGTRPEKCIFDEVEDQEIVWLDLS
jgi:hypothetical protein